MWVSRREFNVLVGERDAARERLARVKAQAREAVAAAQAKALAAEQRTTLMADKLVQIASRPAQIVQPPDTATIVKETVLGMATVLNGWKETPAAAVIQHQMLSPDQQGLDDRGGVPQNLDDFIPPWEAMEPLKHGGFLNGTIGNYKPYIPGEGQTVAPKGGVE